MSGREHELEMQAIGRTVPFGYDHPSRTFLFGDESVALQDFQLYGPFHQQGHALTPADIEAYLKNTAFVATFNHVRSLPLAEDFLEQEWSHSLNEQTRQIVEDVFVETTKRDELYLSEGLIVKPGRDNFDVLVNPCRSEHGAHAAVRLRTQGRCTCIGLDYTTGVFEAIGAMTYTEHNIMNVSQRASLYAGLGFVAALANEYARGAAS